MEISFGLSPIEAGQPLSPATRHRLGEPLPHQLADRNKASPQAPYGFAAHSAETLNPKLQILNKLKNFKFKCSKLLGF